MLSKKKLTSLSVDTLIGKHAFFEGNIKLDGTIRIDGKIKGDVESKGDIIIGESSQIIGNILCNNIIISGIVEGNVTTKEQLRLTPTGKLTGDINSNSLIMDQGSVFNGRCGMTDNNPKKDTSKVSK